MDNCNLIVVDETRTFSARLSAQLKDSGAEITVFWAPDADTVNEIRVNHPARAFLVSEKWREHNRPLDAGGAALLELAEERGDGRQPFAKSDPIARTAAQLIKLLVGRTQIIGVFGAGGGAGNTTMCMALAQGFALRRQRVFVLSLEPYMARSPFSRLGSTGLAEVLVALDEGGDAARVAERALSQPQRFPGIDAFAVTEYNADRAELRPGDAAAVLETLRRMNRWDVILVDLESRMDDRMFEVWALAERMILMIPQTAVGLEKLENVERDLLLREKRGEAELSKLVPVVNFAVSDPGSVAVLKEPVKLALGDLGESVRGMSSEKWCAAFGMEAGFKRIEPILKEVWPQ